MNHEIPKGQSKTAESKEQEKFVMRTLLHIFRHGKKAGGNDVSQAEDLAMTLTPEGRHESMEKGRELERIDDAWSLAVGGPRHRARETAAFTRAGTDPRMTGDEALHEIPHTLEETGPYSGTWTDNRLDMPFEKGVTPDFDTVLAAASENRYLPAMLELYEEARKKGDVSSTFFAVQTRNVASIIERQARVNLELAKRHEYHDENEKGHPEIPQAIERFMGTHAGIVESFLAEVIRRLKGEEEMARFIAAVPNGSGYNQGMTVDIQSTADADKPTIRISYTGGAPGKEYIFNEEVSNELVESIIKDFSPKEQT